MKLKIKLLKKKFPATYVSSNNTAIDHLVEYGSKHEDHYSMYYLISVLFKTDWNGQTNINALFNNQAYHTSSISIAYIDQMIMKYLINENFQLTINNNPFPRKNEDKLNAINFDATKQIQFSNNMQFCISFLVASYLIFLVKEKSTNFKHIQQISGLNLLHYWFSNYLIDLINFLFASFILCLIVYFLNVNTFDSFKHLLYLFIILTGHAVSSLFMIYFTTLFFRDAATAYVRLSLYLLILGTSTFFVVIIMNIPDLNLISVANTLDDIFAMLIPIYTLAMSIFMISENTMGLDICLRNITFRNINYNVQDLCKLNDTTLLKRLIICCKGNIDFLYN